EASKKGSKSADTGQQAKLERITGLLEANKQNYFNTVEKRKIQEDALLSLTNMICSHQTDPLFNAADAYNDDQLKKMDEVSEIIRDLKRLDKDLSTSKKSYY